MTDLLAQLAVWLNAVANGLGTLLAPIALLPGWLSATLVAAVTGVLFLVAFKYTSHQQAIKRVRSDIKANLLALKLFKDSAAVAMHAQGRILVGAFWLMLLGFVPFLAMIVPACLLLSQLGLWYQNRPLHVDEEAVVTMKLNGNASAPWPEVYLEPSEAAEVLVGLRVQSQREIRWSIRAREAGYQRLVFQVDGDTIDKDLAIGDGLMRVSTIRPGWDWEEILLNPWEKPFPPDSPVQSIAIRRSTTDYPERSSWTSGTDWWIGYWFVVSMLAGLCFRRWLNVNI
jgi:hypothetical protein